MTKITEYNSPAKQIAKIEAQRRNEEEQVLQKQLRVWQEIKLKLQVNTYEIPPSQMTYLSIKGRGKKLSINDRVMVFNQRTSSN